MKRRALVIGGSLGGLFAAHLLRAIGWEAVVFERIGDDLASRGVGIGTHDALDEVMRRILPFAGAAGVAVRTAICLDRAGRIAAQMPIFRVMSAWSSYYRPLRDALPAEFYRAGQALVRIEQDKGGVTAHFADGSRETGDLLIGADGIRSTVREQYLPAVRPAYAGYVAWRIMAEEAELPASFRPTLECYGFCLPEGEMALAYPVPGRGGDTGIGRRGYNLVWYRPVDGARTLPDLCTDATGHCHGMAIPPPLIRPAVVAALRADAGALLAPALADIIAGTEQPFFQAIFDLESPQIVMGRVVLLGDAAFVARPHVGAGVTKAAVDATCLTDAIAAGGDLDAALRHYETLECRLGGALVARGRRLGAQTMSAQTGGDTSRDPLAVMREYSGRIKFTRADTQGRASGALLPERRIDYYYD